MCKIGEIIHGTYLVTFANAKKLKLALSLLYFIYL